MLQHSQDNFISITLTFSLRATN